MSAVQRLIFGQHPAGYGARGRTFAHECLQSRLTIAAFTRRNLLERSDPRFRLGQTRERIPSNAWARKIAAPTKPITAVIVSNIANVLYATARQKTAATLHSQKDFPAPTHNPDRPRILRNRRGSSVIQWPAQQLSGRPSMLIFCRSFGLNASGDASIGSTRH